MKPQPITGRIPSIARLEERTQILRYAGALAISFACSAAEIVPLGDLPGGMIFSQARAISANGQVVAGFSYTEEGQQSFVWSKSTGMVGLGASATSLAYGVSPDGTVVVGGSLVLGGDAVRWTVGGAEQALGKFPANGFAMAFATSDNGVVVGTGYHPFSQAFRWTPTTGFVGLGYLPTGYYSEATDVSADGSKILGYGNVMLNPSTAATEAFVWTAEKGLQGLGLYFRAQSFSPDGSIIVGNNGTRAVRWTEAGGLQEMSDLPGRIEGGFVFDVAANGWAVGKGYGEIDPINNSSAHAVMWSPTGQMKPLVSLLEDAGVDLAGQGWTSLYDVEAISADGRYVVGTGRHNGNPEAFWVDLQGTAVPEPKEFAAFVGAALAGFALWRRAASRLRSSGQA